MISLEERYPLVTIVCITVFKNDFLDARYNLIFYRYILKHNSVDSVAQPQSTLGSPVQREDKRFIYLLRKLFHRLTTFDVLFSDVT